MLVYWLDIIGTAVFAISGVLLAGKLRMDPFGVLVLGVVTAVGGGTIRDMALANGPVFWVKDPTDLVVAMVTSMLTILLVRQPRRLPKWILPVLDAVGLAVFVGIGVNKAFLAGSGPLVAVCMGVVTGVGGGIIRDVLAREIPMILRTEIYATRLYRRRYCPRHGTRHLSSPTGEFGNDGDGGHPGNSSGGYSLASEAADVCPGR
ncbi:inner membrane protein [Klebsiella pneumoniae subsp. pneumoniae]|nr:inner membrane protein [Klebsiella pneumoniae subsp. pneumoniae]